ncbi:hypothetical protein DPSP01_003815 [Paraphaeosphaeria sporulosa]
MDQGTMPLRQLSDGRLNEANGGRLINLNGRVGDIEDAGVSKYMKTQIAGKREKLEATATSLPNSEATYVTPKGIATSYPTDENSHSPIISADPSRFVGVPNIYTSTNVQRTKKEPKKRSFNSKWYTSHTTYSDSTLYNKVGLPQMEAFLAGEGVDIMEKFGKGT